MKKYNIILLILWVLIGFLNIGWRGYVNAFDYILCYLTLMVLLIRDVACDYYNKHEKDE